MAKECQKVAFFCISYIKHPYKGRFAKIWLTTPSTSLHMSIPRFFWTSTPICWLLNKSQHSDPPRVFKNKMVDRSHFLILVNVTVVMVFLIVIIALIILLIIVDCCRIERPAMSVLRALRKLCVTGLLSKNCSEVFPDWWKNSYQIPGCPFQYTSSAWNRKHLSR